MKKYKSKIAKLLTTLLIMTQTVTAFGALPTIDSITATHPDYVDFIAHPSITAEEFNTYDITMYYPVLTLNANYPGYTYSVSADGTVYASGVSDNESIALSIPTRNYSVTLSKNNYDTVTQSINVTNDVTINPKLIDTITFIVNKGAGSYKIVNPALGADWSLSGSTTDGVINKIVVPTSGNYELIYTPDDVRKSEASYKFYVEGNYYSYLDTENGYDKLVDGLQDVDNEPPSIEQGAYKKYIVLETQYVGLEDKFDASNYTYDYVIEGLNTSQPYYKSGTTTSAKTEIPVLEQGTYRVTIYKDGYAMKRITDTGVEFYDSIDFTVGPNDPSEEVQYTNVYTPIYVDLREPSPIETDDTASKHIVTLHSQYENYVGTVDSNLYTYEYEIYYNNDSIHGNELATSGTNASVTKQITLPSTGDYKLVIIKDGFALQRTTNGKIEYYNEIPFTIKESTDKVTNLDIQVPLYKKVDLIEIPTVDNTLQKVIISLSSNVKDYNLFVRQADGSYPYKTVVANASGFDVKLPQMGNWVFDVSKYGYYTISDLTVNAQAGSTPVRITLNRLSLGDLIDLIGGEIETGIIDNSGDGLVDNLADKVEDLINEGLLDLDDAQDFVDDLLYDNYIVEDVYDDLVDELIDREILKPKTPTEVPSGGGGGGSTSSNDEDTSSTVDIGKTEVIPPTVPTTNDDSEFDTLADDAIDKYKDGELSDEEYMALLTKAIASKYNYTKAENTIGETDFYITDDNGVEITTLAIPTYVEARDQSTRIAVTDMFGVEGTDFIWNAADKTCSVVFNGKVFLVLYMNSSKITLNGVEGRMVNALGQEIVIDNQSGKLTIPIRFFSEKIGFEVGWNGELRRVTLEAPDETKVDTNLSK